MSIDNDIDDRILRELEYNGLIVRHKIQTSPCCPTCNAKLDINYDCFGASNGYKAHTSLVDCVRYLVDQLDELKEKQ